MLKNWWVALAAMTLLAGGAAVAILPPSESNDDDPMILVSQEGAKGYGPTHFRLEGKPVRGLYPGSAKQMKITVINPYDFRLEVRQLTGQVTRTSRRGCSPTSANLAIQQYTGKLPISVAPHSRLSLRGTLPVAMPWGAAQQCAGAKFTIAVAGLGNRTRR